MENMQDIEKLIKKIKLATKEYMLNERKLYSLVSSISSYRHLNKTSSSILK